MYQNLREAVPEAESLPSVHFCDVPEAVPEETGDARIRQSVARMQVRYMKYWLQVCVYVSVPEETRQGTHASNSVARIQVRCMDCWLQVCVCLCLCQRRQGMHASDSVARMQVCCEACS